MKKLLLLVMICALGSFTVKAQEESEPTVPAAPVVTASAIEDTVRLVWEPVETALFYTLYYDGKQLVDSLFEPAVDIQVIKEGDYCFTVTASNEVGESAHSSEACATVVISPELKVPVAPELEAVLEADTVVLSWNAVEGATYYNVYISGELIGPTQALTVKIGVAGPGEYCFTVTAANMAGESRHSVAACVRYKGDGVEELASAFNVYPNPVSDKLYIETEVEIEEVSIFDIYGRRQELSAVSCQQSAIDVSNLNSGVYFVKIVTENGETVKRFVKK